METTDAAAPLTGQTSPYPRRVVLVGLYWNLSKNGKRGYGYIKTELRDDTTGEVIRTGRYAASLRKFAKNRGWFMRPRNGE